MKKVILIFWLHFIFAATCHILLPIMVVGVIKLLLTSSLGFWLSGLILGCTALSLQFLVNHLFNPNSFCILNHLENHYRQEEGLPLQFDGFLPRFYKKCKEIKDVFNPWS